MADRTCSVSSCPKRAKSRGWCNTHYERWRRCGDVAPDSPDLRRERQTGTCSLDECNSAHYSKGMCKPHYRQEYYTRNRQRELDGMAAWRRRNQEYDRARWAAFFIANRDILADRSRERYAANAVAERLRAAKWRKLNPDRCRNWRQSNPEKARELVRRYQARKKAATVEKVDYAAILDRHGMVCHICDEGIEMLTDLHFDHVIPLSKGGPHSAENIRPSHALCNLRKGARII